MSFKLSFWCCRGNNGRKTKTERIRTVATNFLALSSSTINLVVSDVTMQHVAGEDLDSSPRAASVCCIALA